MSDYPGLCNSERVDQSVSQVEKYELREAVRLIIDGVRRFFAQQPSQLMSPFDLVFFTEVLRERIDLIGTDLREGWRGWWDEGQYPEPRAIENRSDDTTDWGIRVWQADNYVAALDYDRSLQAALLVVKAWATLKQRPNAKNLDGTPSNFARPVEPLDHLFMVMAVHYALRPGQPARLLLEQGNLDG